MTDAFIQIGVTSVIGICGFFIVRWMTSIDDKMKTMTDAIEKIKEQQRQNSEFIEHVRTHGIMEDTCAANHNDLLKCLNRERYRINSLEDRLNSGEFKSRAPRKSFSEIGAEDEQQRLARIIRGGGTR